MKLRFVRKLIVTCLLAFASLAAIANTWDEPWHRDVVSKSDALGLFEVKSVKNDSAVLQLRKIIAGEISKTEIIVSGYHMLQVTSASSNDWDVWLKPGKIYYIFLKKGSDDKWQFATPSAGIAEVQADGDVQATFRHSLHQAIVPSSLYEILQMCIFDVQHRKGCNDVKVKEFISEQVSLPAATLEEDSNPEQWKAFFLQHAAIESAGLAKLSMPSAAISKFLNASFFHTQMSILNYLASTEEKEKMNIISEYVCGVKASSMAKAYGILLLESHNARSEAVNLRKCLSTLTTEEVGMGNLMDPRVGTAFPNSPREGAEKLLATWSAL